MHGWSAIICTVVCLQDFYNSCNNINPHHCSMHPERQDLLKMVLQHPVRTTQVNTSSVGKIIATIYVKKRKFVLVKEDTCHSV